MIGSATCERADARPAVARGSGIGLSRAYFAAKKCAGMKPGRPKDPDSARSREPWRALGISQRTFYRRQAARIAKDPPPQQHGAHVADWYAQLGPIAQLDHKAFMRRCVRAHGMETARRGRRMRRDAGEEI